MAERDSLADEPFSYVPRADGSIVIDYRGAPVTVLPSDGDQATRVDFLDT